MSRECCCGACGGDRVTPRPRRVHASGPHARAVSAKGEGPPRCTRDPLVLTRSATQTPAVPATPPSPSAAAAASSTPAVVTDAAATSSQADALLKDLELERLRKEARVAALLQPRFALSALLWPGVACGPDALLTPRCRASSSPSGSWSLKWRTSACRRRVLVRAAADSPPTARRRLKEQVSPKSKDARQCETEQCVVQ
jgi:hypothetical protein